MSAPLTYWIKDDGDHLPSITCLFCGFTSYNPHDIEERYCGRCHRFHEAGKSLPPPPESGGGPIIH